MKKEITEITFADGTKGTITTETITGRVDVKAAYNDVVVFYYAEKNKSSWIIKCCVNGFCADALVICTKKTRKAAISEIIMRVRENQSRIADIENELPTPSDEPKTEEEEEAAAEHFVKQMSDARRMNNWKKLLFEKLYDGNTEHDKIYCNTNYGKIFGWYWNEKGAEQFQRLYGGDKQEIDSRVYFIYEIHDLFLEIICGVETDEISIERQLIEKCYLPDIKNRPEYIFDTLLSCTYMFELQELILEMKMKSYVKEIEKYLVQTRRDFLYKNKDPEKTILAFCKDMEYLTERIIADYFKEVKNNDNP